MCVRLQRAQGPSLGINAFEQGDGRIKGLDPLTADRGPLQKTQGIYRQDAKNVWWMQTIFLLEWKEISKETPEKKLVRRGTEGKLNGLRNRGVRGSQYSFRRKKLVCQGKIKYFIESSVLSMSLGVEELGVNSSPLEVRTSVRESSHTHMTH